MAFNGTLRQFLRRGMALAAGSVILHGCANAGATPMPARQNAWTLPHVLTISDASGADFTTLNPHQTNGPPAINLSEMTMAWLLKWDEHNQLYPELATSVPTKTNGGVSTDGLTITYHLRKGVRWSDGAPFTADDVVFSAQAVNNVANKEPRFDMLARVTAPDKFTAVFHLRKPYSLATKIFFSSCCANPPLLPKHLLAKYSNINDVPYNALPVGIAPFKFVRWERKKQIVMVADPLYWRGRPKLDKIIYKIFADRDALLAAMKQHKVDMWYQFTGAYVPSVQSLKGYAVYHEPGYVYTHYDFNLKRSALTDVRVRRALRLALDRRELVRTVEHGIGVVQDSPTPANSPFFVDLGATPYNPQKANALLDEAGWMRGADGIRAKNGIRLDLNVATLTGRPHTDEQLELVRKDWNEIGVAIKVQHYTASELFDPTNYSTLQIDTWDVTPGGWATDAGGDYQPFYGCDAAPPNGINDLGWCNKKADAAMGAFLRDYDQAQRTADLKIAMQEFVRDVPSIVVFMREDLFAHNTDLKNYHPNNLTWFDNMMNVDI